MLLGEEPIDTKYLTPLEYFLRIPAGVGRIAGVVCAGLVAIGGAGIEPIVAGFTLAYFSDSYIKNTDARAHAREQAKILGGIEEKLK